MPDGSDGPADELLAGLNESQRRAVPFKDGPLLILAGPGSGKTRVITHRIAYLVRHHRVHPAQILAVTFTNKAAKEMQRRLGTLLRGRLPLACTFHSFCARTLRLYSQLIDRSPRYSIIDQRERLKVFKELLAAADFDAAHFPPAAVEKRIGTLKNDLVDPAAFADRPHDFFGEIVAKIYPRYQQRLRELNALDFDDLLCETAYLLQREPKVRADLDRQYRYVLVDEYQDTNLAQYAIARALSVDAPNLCVTGDPDQSIYSWRGADLNNILNFEQDFPGATTVTLEQNYRSTGNILAVADELIRNNAVRKDKGLTTDNDLGREVAVHCYRDEVVEANSVAERIRSLVDAGERRYRDVAVFVRVNNLTRAVEAAFRNRGVPYQIVGGYSFFERKEVRDLLAYCRLLLNPKDDAAFARIVNVPPRGIGKTTLDRLARHAGANGLSLAEAAAQADGIAAVKGRPLKSLTAFAALLEKLARVTEMAPHAALETVVQETGYRESVSGDDEEEEQEHLGYIDEMLRSAEMFAAEVGEADLTAFVQGISLASDLDRIDGEADQVTVMTLHAAKGLEFPVVFMIAFEQEVLPHQRSLEADDIEEERRLAFVGITRAMEDLFLSYVRMRSLSGRTAPAIPSQFLRELPTHSLSRQDVVAGAAPAAQPDWSDDEFNQDAGDDWAEPSIQILQGASGASPSDRFRVGMVIRHERYGYGKILVLDGVGDNRRAGILFPELGTKRFVLAQAPIEPATEEF